MTNVDKNVNENGINAVRVIPKIKMHLSRHAEEIEITIRIDT